MSRTSSLRLSRRVWTQLAILASVTVLSVAVMALGFVKVPALLGVGRYTVKVDLPASGGLYPTSVVNYRGSEVGSVKSVDVTQNGVRAILSLKSDIAIPSNVTAAVHSRSAIGEQFLELTPHSGTANDTGPTLRDGDVIAVGKTQIPVDIGSLLDTTNKALQAIPQDNLHTVVDEASKAVAGLGPELSRLVDGGTSLAIDAGKTSDTFSRLIDEFPPVASSQVRTSDSIATWARRVNSITSQLKAQDNSFADLLNTAGPALGEATALFDRLSPTLPVLLANLVSLGNIALTYRNDLEELLVLFPQGTAVMSSIIVPDRVAKQDYKGIYLDFNLNLNLPPPCNTGFLPVQQQRIPVREDYPDRTDGELYCRIPQNSDMNVRGVRNTPCETRPGKRAPTIEMCESDEQYVPLNDGLFWKGDPNATLSGQTVPQFPKGAPTPSPGRDWHPPPESPVRPPVAIPYDPATGNYVGPDGRAYSESDLAFTSKGKTWQDMMVPPKKPNP
jgi:phospholipid/cholesterol/gamma-HCH transport system substrate-binding protein